MFEGCIFVFDGQGVAREYVPVIPPYEVYAEMAAQQRKLHEWEADRHGWSERRDYETCCPLCDEFVCLNDFVIEGYTKSHSIEWGPGADWSVRAWCPNCDQPIEFCDGYP